MNREYHPGHEGKVIFYSKKAAIFAMRYRNHGRKMRIYMCFVDGKKHWHLTSMSKAQFKLGKRGENRRSHGQDQSKRRLIANHELKGLEGQINEDVGDF